MSENGKEVNRPTKSHKHRKFTKWESAIVLSTAALIVGLAVVGSPQVSFAGYQ